MCVRHLTLLCRRSLAPESLGILGHTRQCGIDSSVLPKSGCTGYTD